MAKGGLELGSVHRSFIERVLFSAPDSHTLLPELARQQLKKEKSPRSILSRRLLHNDTAISERLVEFCTGHGITASEPDVISSDDLMSQAGSYSYFLSISPSINYTEKVKTSFPFCGKTYIFDGFVLISEKQLNHVPPLCFQQYGYSYTVTLHTMSEQLMVSKIEALLFEEFLFNNLLQLFDFTYVLRHLNPGVYFIPRFTSAGEDEKAIALSHVLHWLSESRQLLTPYLEAQLKDRSGINKLCNGWIITNPNLSPTSIRVDRLEWPQETQRNMGLPNVVHFSSYFDENAQEDESRPGLQEFFRSSSKEVLLSISPHNFLMTGLHTDIVQHALLAPLMLHHILYHRSLPQLENKLNYSFRNRQLLERALTQPSFSHLGTVLAEQSRPVASNCGVRRPYTREERSSGSGRDMKADIQCAGAEFDQERLRHNEQLEFLGDAALEYLCSLHLYHMFPEAKLGQLALYRTLLVKNKHLAMLAHNLELHKYLLVGGSSGSTRSLQSAHCSKTSNTADAVECSPAGSMDAKAHVNANTLEAIVGAVYLDSGLGAAQQLTAQLLFPGEELQRVWINYPPHPLQVDHPAGDRHLIPHSSILQKLVELEEATGVRFKHIRLLAKAFTHSSMMYSHLAGGSYEKMEHLGDAVLQFLVSEYLYHRFPTLHEGHLSLLRISLVQNRQLAELCKQLGFDKYIRTETDEVGVKIQADVVESYLAALLLDKGLKYCQKFLEVCLFPKLMDIVEKSDVEDANTQLQKATAKFCRQHYLDPEPPIYRQLSSSQNPPFTVGVYFKGQRLGTGVGWNRREARREAAKKALGSDKLKQLGTQR